jgi:integrase
MRLAEIEPQHIKRWLSSLAARGYAQSTIRSTFAPVRAMLADAAEEGVIRSNPAAGVRIPANARAPEANRRKSLTDDEVARLRAELTSAADRLLVDCLLVTGLRISEAIALDFGDVDFGRCRVSITKRYYRGFDVPKSAYGIRKVPITPTLARRLWAMRKDRQAREADPLFVGPRGERMDYANAYNRVLKPAMRKAGIPWGGAHRRRHTTATHLIREGASANQAQLWLGHHDPGFTARTYVHLDGNDLPDPSIFDSYLVEDGPPTQPARITEATERAEVAS